jgi:hypothetical protein
MALNDHWLKSHFPGFLTGKLSDFCGIFYLPIFLLALIVGVRILWRRSIVEASAVLTTRNLGLAIFVTDCLLISVKLSPTIATGVEDFFREFLFQIRLIPDPTDLMALVMSPLTALYMRPYLQRSKGLLDRIELE